MFRRTHIFLTFRQWSLLREEADRTGLSVSELIRRAIDTVYRPHEPRKLKGYEFTIALWRQLDAALVGRRVKPR